MHSTWSSVFDISLLAVESRCVIRLELDLSTDGMFFHQVHIVSGFNFFKILAAVDT